MGRPKLYHTEEERREARRRTVAKYDASPKGKASHQRSNHGPKATARYARYRQTEGYAEAQARYKSAESSKVVATEASRRWRASNPAGYAAHVAVGIALRDGRLVRPEACSNCGSTDKLDAHHHMGYVGHELDVTWLCRWCHKAIH